MNFCNDYHFLEGVRIIFYILTILKFVIPILLIGFGSYDFFQTVLNPEKDQMTEKLKSFGMRIASAIIIFLLPTIISVVFSIFTNFSSALLGLEDCLKNANTGYIEQLKISQKIALEEQMTKDESYNTTYDSSKYQNKKPATSSQNTTGSNNDSSNESSGNSSGEYGDSQNANSPTELLAIADKLWKQVASGNFTYGGSSIPPTTQIDCSAYVTWVLYEYIDKHEFRYQHNTLNFINTNWNEKYGWEEIPVAKGEDITSKLQPGDILVRDNGSGGSGGHMNITVSVENGKVMAYDCGKESRWRNSGGNPADTTWFAKDSRSGKIIRINN